MHANGKRGGRRVVAMAVVRTVTKWIYVLADHNGERSENGVGKDSGGET